MTEKEGKNGGITPSGRRRSSLLESVQRRLNSHFMSTLALCSSVFTMLYLLMSVFPYSGFMILHLIPTVDREHAGLYAGFLSSSFMIGRAISGYPWGILADIYGRKFVLVFSLLASAAGSLAFGCSTSFGMAMAVRFATGLGNGTMVAARTAISELAKGDKELESKGVGILMSMVGFGMLFSPALGGFLSEPLRQYPDAIILGGAFDDLLRDYPFLPPNIIASILAILSMLIVILSVEETLPVEKRRHWTHAGGDLWRYLVDKIGRLCCRRSDSFSDISTGPVGTTEASMNDDDDDDDNSSIEDDLRILERKELEGLSTLLATRTSRASVHAALRRASATSQLSAQEQDPERALPARIPRRRSSAVPPTEGTPLIAKADEPNTDTSVSAIMANPSTKAYLISYWVSSFSNVCQGEAFPLFAMSTEGGLGMEEKKIGWIGTLSGLMFCVAQYFVFTQAMKRYGLVGALRMGSFWGSVPVVLVPFSLFLSGSIQTSFLALIMGVLMICNSVYLGCNTIGANRTVEASQRAAMNGLSSVGTSLGRGLGPIVAGLLVAFFLTSPFLSATVGGWCIYVVLGTVGLASYWTTLMIPEEEEEKVVAS